VANCCGDFPLSVFITPSQVNMQVGQSVTMSAFEQRIDCYGFEYVVPVSASWSSNNTSVATVSGGQVTSQGAGQATITASRISFHSMPAQCGTGFGPPPTEPFSCCRNTATSRSGTASVTVGATSVRIKMGNTDITNTTRNVIVGQKISLIAEVQPSGQQISNPQWTVPGTAIANYVASITKGEVTALSNPTSSTIDFYWVDGGDGRQVQYSVTINGQPFSGKATFNVKRPTAQITTSTGTIQISAAWPSGNGLWYGVPNQVGISFSANVTIPTGFAGDVQWVQIWNKLRRVRASNGRWFRSSGTGIDSAYPYSSGNSANDSPGVAFDTHIGVFIDESFDMYLMFQPTGLSVPTIWVPLKVINWSWFGDASLNGSTWVLNSSNKTTGQASDTTTHPVWTKNAADFPFTLEP
jgi:hypothetical protein